MAEHAAAERRRNWLIALAAAALLLILLALTLSFCQNTSAGDRTTAAPGASGSAETLPPVSGPGTLSPKTTGSAAASATGNDDKNVAPATTTPLATKSATPSKKPSKKPATTKATPAGGVDAGGGAGLTGRRSSLLVAGVFLLLAALVTARFAIGRAARD